MRKFLMQQSFRALFALALVLLLTTAGLAGVSGTYQGEARGYGGALVVEVTLENDVITSIQVLSHEETPMLSDSAFDRVPNRIIAEQSLAIDSVTGATATSVAIVEAVAAALGSAGIDVDLWSLESAPEAGEATARSTVSKTADVVIIGGGGAGLAAAISAAEEGASVIVLEKMPVLGGNTVRSGGAYNAADPERQQEQGISDSIELHFQHTYEGGDQVGQPRLIEILVEGALAGKHWLESYGMEFRDSIGSVIGSLWPRSHQAVKPAGTGFLATLTETANALGVEILMETEAVSLVMDEEGTVVGVIARSDQEDLEIMADAGVIIATGGFAANIDMRTQFVPSLTADIPTTNHPGATGSGIIMGQEMGAAVVDMDKIQMLPIAMDTVGTTINVENVFFVNREGHRFVAEDERRDRLVEAVLAQTRGQYWMINDAQIVGERNELGQSIETLIEEGSVFRADTIEELAVLIDVPAETLAASLAQFNEAVEQKTDEFGRGMWYNKVQEGPFYATLRYPAVHHTMGGLVINERTQVLKDDGSVIPGLFAAGEVTGGIHGANRLGGNALTDVIVFGRIAGKEVLSQ